MLGHFHEKHHLRAWLLHRRSPSLPTWSAEVRTVPGSLKSFGGQQEDVRYGFATGFDKAEISESYEKMLVCMFLPTHIYEQIVFAVSHTYEML